MSVEIPQLQLKRTAQKAKGPAEVAASPSHGPAALEKTMNEKDASTTAPAMANRAPIFDLENPTLELERFASILSDLTDDLFNRNHRKPGGLDGMIMVKTRDSALDDIEFIVSKVYGLANRSGMLPPGRSTPRSLPRVAGAWPEARRSRGWSPGSRARVPHGDRPCGGGSRSGSCSMTERINDLDLCDVLALASDYLDVAVPRHA